MSEPVHLFIVTDDAYQASYDVIGVHLVELPSFVRIVTKADDIRRLPTGVRCFGCWFAWGAREHDEAQLAWQERKDRGGLEGVTVTFLEKLDDWRAKRRVAEENILAEQNDAAVMSFEEFSNAHAAAHAVPSEKVTLMPKQQRWS
ncbi:hypothetical protein AM571_CH01412 [Rhizobium etli 8C-3]|uniref:Uncharacterized protein n=1 Tax=Rhizobium etli 8C-3 TaxID=538025 RepID=A0A1L5P291_RHIET|nr:hypothetical protein [Rhizobium etli]APO74247.1 hypothetical protein AM571_CH01412 [Rhizobium etli 8C-3]